MKGMRVWLAAIITLVVAALMIPAGAVGAPRSSLVVVSGMWSPPNNFSPINTDSSYGYYVVRFIFQGMLEARLENNQMRFTPALASRWRWEPTGRRFALPFTRARPGTMGGP
jgi:ABC-type oligopeptide transport system substrate-binding subunit